MEKFSQMQYVRPDLAAFAGRIEAYTAELKAAGSAEQVYDLLLTHKNDMAECMTMRSIANIRNTVDTRDPFYEEEVSYFNREWPKLNLLLRKANEALLASPFRLQLEEKLGSLFFKNMEIQKQFADERIVEDLVRESQLTQRYSKVSATASIEFRGEDCNFYRLLKFMQSTDRQLRKEAFRAWAELYSRIAAELDGIYDEMVQLRHGMAQKLGFACYTDMAYLMRRRYDYGPAEAASFRRQVKEVITPICAALRKQQAERLGVEKLRYYDEPLFYPEGNPVPQGDRSQLVAKAQKMYREMSRETGEFFDAMVEYELFDLESKLGKRPGGYCTSLPK